MLDSMIDKMLEEVPNGVRPPRNKYLRILWKRKRVLRLYRETRRKYGVGLYYCHDKQRLVRYTVNKKSVRTMCNRKFRKRMKQYCEPVSDGGAYRKHEEYWWSVC